MYRDLSNFIVLPYRNGISEHNVKNKISEVPATAHAEIVDIGCFNYDTNKPFDKHFYDNFNMPHEKRWTSFYIQRSPDAEKKLTKALNPNNEPYIFLHEDGSRRYRIDRERIPKDIKIISPDKTQTNNIFLYIDLIQNAKEIHCIDSSFLNLIEHTDTGSVPVIFHRYPRPGSLYGTPSLRKNWIIHSNK